MLLIMLQHVAALSRSLDHRFLTLCHPPPVDTQVRLDTTHTLWHAGCRAFLDIGALPTIVRTCSSMRADRAVLLFHLRRCSMVRKLN